MLYTKLWGRTTLQSWNCNQTNTFQPRVLCLWLTTHGCEVWFQAQVFMQTFFLCLSPVYDSLQYINQGQEGSAMYTHTRTWFMHTQRLMNSSPIWCPHPYIYMEVHAQWTPTSAKISSENLINDPFIWWKCPTVLKHQNITSHEIQTPQELHCCLMLAQISTTHIHKQIEPVLPGLR